jgi:hypothetical protein
MYSQNVVFIEVEGKSEPEEIVHTKNNSETVWFKLRNKEYGSYESTKYEEEVEQ